MKEISFLLGAGFSKPAGYQLGCELSQQLSDELKNARRRCSALAEISSQAEDYRKKLLTRRYREIIEADSFAEEFLEFYTNICNANSQFNYEDFFDDYNSLLNGYTSSTDCKRLADEFRHFADEFRRKHNATTNNLDLLGNFHEKFEQCIAKLLARPSEPVKSSYGAFDLFLDDVRKIYDKVHVHTLNHDLFFEKLAADFIWEFSDGFEEAGSHYYSKVELKNADEYLHRPITLRIPQFSNRFNHKLCLYKLHGSIDYYSYRLEKNEVQSIRVSPPANPEWLLREVKQENGESDYEKRVGKFFPDFLSGLRTKPRHYGLDYYYGQIFNRFEANLEVSDTLVTIGYGQEDKRINELIIERFRCSSAKKLIVVDPKPKRRTLLGLPCAYHFGENLGVDDITFEGISRLAGWQTTDLEQSLGELWKISQPTAAE